MQSQWDRSFRQIFFGLLIDILDISVNGFDLMVDGIGYVLIAMGCAGLVNYSNKFQLAKRLAITCGVVWLIKLLSFALPIWFDVVEVAIYLVMMWQLLGGIIDLAKQKHRVDFEMRASNVRYAYVGIIGTTTAIGVLSNYQPQFATPFAFVLVMLMFVVLVLILVLVHRARLELFPSFDEMQSLVPEQKYK